MPHNQAFVDWFRQASPYIHGHRGRTFVVAFGGEAVADAGLFAPAVLAEDVADWFEFDRESPYMLMVAPVATRRRPTMTAAEQALFGIDKLNVPRSEIPAVTHVDYSARLQTVHAETNPRFHALLTAFKGRTGCPVLVNTSFNIRGEPIVCTPEDAFRCFMGSEIESLAVGNCYLAKADQDPSLKREYRDDFGLD